MRQKPTWRQYLLQIAVGLPVAIWLGLQVAPSHYGENLFVISQGLNAAMQHPFQFTLCANSGKSVLTLCAIYIFALLAYFSTKRNTRYGEEHGSARWGEPVAVCRKLRDKEFRNNRILSQNVRIGYDFYRHQRNLNACVVGGSGSKKSRSHVIPNVMQCECSKIILDPMGEILAGTGNLLLEEGYEVRVLDLIEMEKSNHYNPFVYIRNENDLQTMVTFLFAATNPGDSKGQDPFWEQSAQMLLMALCFYLWLEAPPEEQNFAMVSEAAPLLCRGMIPATRTIWAAALPMRSLMRWKSVTPITLPCGITGNTAAVPEKPCVPFRLFWPPDWKNSIYPAWLP